MRIYIIGNGGITLCREPPATVNKGEIAVASREELRAARLSGSRLLALWNALPGVEKQTKVGDRNILIDRLWSAIEALPQHCSAFSSRRVQRFQESDNAQQHKFAPRVGLAMVEAGQREETHRGYLSAARLDLWVDGIYFAGIEAARHPHRREDVF